MPYFADFDVVSTVRFPKILRKGADKPHAVVIQVLRPRHGSDTYRAANEWVLLTDDASPFPIAAFRESQAAFYLLASDAHTFNVCHGIYDLDYAISRPDPLSPVCNMNVVISRANPELPRDDTDPGAPIMRFDLKTDSAGLTYPTITEIFLELYVGGHIPSQPFLLAGSAAISELVYRTQEWRYAIAGQIGVSFETERQAREAAATHVHCNVCGSIMLKNNGPVCHRCTDESQQREYEMMAPEFWTGEPVNLEDDFIALPVMDLKRGDVFPDLQALIEDARTMNKTATDYHLVVCNPVYATEIDVHHITDRFLDPLGHFVPDEVLLGGPKSKARELLDQLNEELKLQQYIIGWEPSDRRAVLTEYAEKVFNEGISTKRTGAK